MYSWDQDFIDSIKRGGCDMRGKMLGGHFTLYPKPPLTESNSSPTAKKEIHLGIKRERSYIMGPGFVFRPS